MTLPTYRPHASCPKCGSAGVSVTYVPVGSQYACYVLRCVALGAGRADCGAFKCNGSCREEHLHRTCPRCGYAWPEAVLSAAMSQPERKPA